MVEEDRSEAYEAARSLLDELETTLFVLRTQSLLARRAWRNSLSGPELSVLTSPASAFARDVLERLNALALKRGKKLSDLSDEQRHELRIALKNMRYAAEFFGSLFGPRKKIEAYLRRVSALQALLGAHNDVVTAKQLLATCVAKRGPSVDGAVGFVIGWHARGATIADQELREAWRKFKRIEPFWR